MTRKKQNDDERSEGFRQTPFKALKGFTAAGRPSKTPPPASIPAGSPEDDEAVFRRAMNGARPLHAPVRSQAGRGPQPAEKQHQAAAPDEHVFLEAMRTLGAATFGTASRAEEGPEDAGTRSPSRRMRQLKRGTLRIGAELDLHGLIKDEALRRLEHFLASAEARGLDAALVITGRGTNSPNGPVLPGAVATWLRGVGMRYAAEFHPAPRDRGGSGAFVVFLRKR